MVAAREPASEDCASVHAAFGYAANGYTVADYLGLLGCIHILFIFRNIACTCHRYCGNLVTLAAAPGLGLPFLRLLGANSTPD